MFLLATIFFAQNENVLCDCSIGFLVILLRRIDNFHSTSFEKFADFILCEVIKIDRLLRKTRLFKSCSFPFHKTDEQMPVCLCPRASLIQQLILRIDHRLCFIHFVLLHRMQGSVSLLILQCIENPSKRKPNRLLSSSRTSGVAANFFHIGTDNKLRFGHASQKLNTDSRHDFFQN